MEKKKYYKVSGLTGNDIREVEVERETESSIWINGNRHPRFSHYDKYFPTRSGAKDFIVDKIENDIRALKSRLEYAEQNLEKAKAL